MIHAEFGGQNSASKYLCDKCGDRFIKNTYVPKNRKPFYKNKTTLLITTDHGRGNVKKEEWTSHGQSVADAHETWFAFIGPNVKAVGEVKSAAQVYQQQLVPTLVNLMGASFKPSHVIAKPAVSVVSNK